MSAAKYPIERADLDGIAGAELPWELLQDSTVLVTGGGGFLASFLIKALLHTGRQRELNLRVVCLTRSLSSVQARLAAYVDANDFQLVLHDLSHPLPATLPHAHIIVHSASQASPKRYGVDPVGTLLPNVVGTHHLLGHAHRHATKRFLFFSSGEVYGQTADPLHALHEQAFGALDPMQVRSCYAESKRMGEAMISAWSAQYGLHANVVRPFHTYGPGMALDDGRVFADFVADVLAKRDIVLQSDGLATRCFCYVADATLGFLTILLRGEAKQAYNIANPQAEISMSDLAFKVAGLHPAHRVGVRIKIPEASTSYLQSPVRHARPSIAKAQALGWTPSTGIEDGFRRTIQSYLD